MKKETNISILELFLLEMYPLSNKYFKKGKRKVQGVPQSQTAALPRPQEEEETDKLYVSYIMKYKNSAINELINS